MGRKFFAPKEFSVIQLDFFAWTAGGNGFAGAAGAGKKGAFV